MTDIGEFVWAGLAGGGLSAVLLAIAAVLGKSQLAHWLNKDIEAIKAKHQQDLAEKQAQYQRELEVYRMSLIAQVEAIKAGQDVRKTMALRVAEKRFEAIFGIHKLLNGVSVDLLALMKLSLHPQHHEDIDQISGRVADLKSSIGHAVPFFDTSELVALYDLLDQLYVLLPLARESNMPIPAHVLEPHRKKTLACHAAAATVVQVRMREMLDMG
jgi:hypothetical protein